MEPIDQSPDRRLTRWPRRNKEDMVQLGVPSAEKVAHITGHFGAQPLGRLGRAVPFDEEHHLPFGGEVATPAIGCQILPAFSVQATTALFSDPVVEAFSRQRPAGRRQGHEETVGLQVMAKVETMLLGVPASANEPQRVLAAAGREQQGPSNGKQENGMTSTPARRLECVPTMDQVVIL